MKIKQISAETGWTLALAAFGVLVAAAIGGTGHGEPLWTEDSPSYIAWSVTRTPLYPLVLSIVGALSPQFGLLAWLQYAALIGATILFARALGALIDSPRLGLATGALTFLNVYLMRQPTSMHPEAIYLSLILLHCAAVMTSFRDPRLRWPLLAGLALSLAILARPVGYAYVFALPWLLLVWPARRWRRAAVLAAAIAVPILGVSAVDYVWRGYFATQEFGGMNLGLQVAEFLPARLDGAAPEPVAKAFDAMTPSRATEARVDSWPMLTLIEILNSGTDDVAIMQLSTDLVAADEDRWRSANPNWRDIGANRAIWEVSTRLVAMRPVDYIAKVARQFYGLWVYPQMVDPATAARVFDLYRTVAGEDAATARAPLVKIVPGWFWAAKMAGCAAIFLACCAALALGLFAAGPALPALGYLSLTIFAYFGVTAAVELAIGRYSLEAWPEQCAILVGMALIVWRRRPFRPASGATDN
jgi:hypothetical protein